MTPEKERSHRALCFKDCAGLLARPGDLLPACARVHRLSIASQSTEQRGLAIHLNEAVAGFMQGAQAAMRAHPICVMLLLDAPLWEARSGMGLMRAADAALPHVTRLTGGAARRTTATWKPCWAAPAQAPAAQGLPPGSRLSCRLAASARARRARRCGRR